MLLDCCVDVDSPDLSEIETFNLFYLSILSHVILSENRKLI